jgi:hypothetical protein
MPEPGSLPGREGAASRARGALAFGVAAALGVAAAWGFSVDDALISARVASHLARGQGYRFNAAGPVVDCVTPLGWAFLLAPVAKGGAWQAMTWASAGGAMLWIAAAALLGRRCAEWCSGFRLLSLAVILAASLPLGAWAAAGMETGLIMALGVGALGRSPWSALFAGTAAALRPELVPWAVALGVGGALARRDTLRGHALALALTLVPALGVAVVRELAFGRSAPLAVFAKPSDFEHGLRYAFGAVCLSGPPWLLFAVAPWKRLAREQWAVAAALAVHGVVLVGVGGDWMPFWRLAMPALPGVFLLGATLSQHARVAPHALRVLAALACAATLHTFKGAETRSVRGERATLLASVAPLLAGAERVASLDVGWVGAAGDYTVVDLAGVTDEEVAFLPGGHTSKRLPVDFLERRNVDALVLLLAPDARVPPSTGSRVSPDVFARQVEQRSMSLRGADRFAEVGRVRLNARQDYAVLRRDGSTIAALPAVHQGRP